MSDPSQYSNVSTGGPGQDPAGTIEVTTTAQAQGLDAEEAARAAWMAAHPGASEADWAAAQGSGGTTNGTNTGTTGAQPGVNPGGAVQGLTGYNGGTGAAAGQGTSAQNDALSILQGVFQQYGFSASDQTSLSTWAWNLITQGYDATAIQTQLYQTPQFKARFPAIAQRQAAGLPPISPGDYVSYENQVAQYGNQYGIPKSFTDQFITQWIGGDTSMAEVGQRLQDYAQAAYQSNPAMVNQLQQLYGVTPGELISFFADPTTALPIIQQRFQSAQIAGQAQIAGYQQLSVDQAQQLAQQGVTQSQAQAGFQQLGLESQLFSALPGQTGQPGIDMTTQLGAQFLGNAQDVRTIQLEALRRQAAFQGGGSYASGTRGTTGLGTEQGAQA